MNTFALARKAKATATALQSTLVFEGVYRKFKNYTMIDKTTYRNNLRIIDSWPRVAGCVVECGTWRGGMIAGIADVLGPGRRYFLFDSFEGLPPAQAIDGPAAISWQSDTQGRHYHDNCRAPVEIAEEAMAMSRAREYEIRKGWFADTLGGFRPPEPIAVLRLDADWYESTLTCLECLYEHMAEGGIILVDDYYTWDGCSKAVHHFLAKGSNARIAQFGGVCILVPGEPRRASDLIRALQR